MTWPNTLTVPAKKGMSRQRDGLYLVTRLVLDWTRVLLGSPLKGLLS